MLHIILIAVDFLTRAVVFFVARAEFFGRCCSLRRMLHTDVGNIPLFFNQIFVRDFHDIF